MLPLTEASYHTHGPKDLGLDPEKKSVMSIDIARTTNHTGEQIHISVPMYSDDDRAAVQKRLGFAYSVIQDRMEQENKAVEFANSRNETIRRADVIIAKNEAHFQLELKKLAKASKQKKMTEEEFNAAKAKLVQGLKAANEATQQERDHAYSEVQAGQVIPKPDLDVDL